MNQFFAVLFSGATPATLRRAVKWPPAPPEETYFDP
jgi:hypothetical protein